MRTILALLGVSLLAISLSGSSLAGEAKKGEAPKYPQIQLTKIQEFDPSLTKAKGIHERLEATENKLQNANKSLAATLKLPETTSIEDSLAELRKRADNKIELALEKGRIPRLKPTDAVPSDVQQGIDTVNGMMDDLGASLEQIEAMPTEVDALIKEVQTFPSQLKPELLKKNNIAVTELGKLTKTLNADLKAIEATPERIKAVTDQTMNLFGKVQKAFQG